MTTKKSEKIEVPVDPKLKQWAEAYSANTGFSVAAILRAIMRRWFDPADPRPLPPGVEAETKRPPRK